MTLNLINVEIDRFKGNFLLSLIFEGGFRRSFTISNDKFYSVAAPFDGAFSFSTVDGFLSRSGLSWQLFSSVDSDDRPVTELVIELPTMCGYLGRSGKWLRSGRFHRRFIVDLSNFLDDLHII